VDLLYMLLKERKINVMDGIEILIWGAQGSGIFSIKQAYNLIVNHDNSEPEGIWQWVWN
jgi:hypothetical protein